jgi:hypothetical protein
MAQPSWGAAWLSGSNPARDSSQDNPGVEKKTEQIFPSAATGDCQRSGLKNIPVVSEDAQVILRKDVQFTQCCMYCLSSKPMADICLYMHDVCMASV